MNPGRSMISVLALVLLFETGWSKERAIQRESLQTYIERMQQQPSLAAPPTNGSLWTDQGRLAFLTGDYKAAHVGDLITILVVQDVTASNANSVATDRKFSTNSGISGLAGHLKTSGVQNLLTASSATNLAGKSQASTTSKLQTTLAGRVLAVLPSGVMVIQAEREITMNNEKQTILLRGLVRSGDIAPDNVVVSNTIGNLELELKGKGVLSDGTRPPNPLFRVLLRIIGF